MSDKKKFYVKITAISVAVYLFIALLFHLTDPGSHPLAEHDDILRYRLDVREWGVAVVQGRESSAELLTTPTESKTMTPPKPGKPIGTIQVREPVIYFDAENVDSVTVSVNFTSGKPTVTFPPAKYDSSTASWEVHFDSSDYSLTDSGVSSCLKEVVKDLNNVTASPLRVDGVRARSLFYEGEMEYRNRIRRVAGDRKHIVVKNENPYPLNDVWYVVPEGEGMRYFHNDSVPSGESIMMLVDSINVISPAMKQSFPKSEIAAFRKFWQEPVASVQKENSSTYRRDPLFFYRLPRYVVDSLLPLNFSVEPTTVERVLHVLAYVSPKRNKSVPLGFPKRAEVERRQREVRGLTRSRAAVMRQMRSQFPVLKEAIGREFPDQGSSKATVKLEWSILPSGKVSGCEVVSSNSNNKKLDTFLLNKVKMWTFDPIRSEGDTHKIAYSFVIGE